jgi:hypothetical protein
MNRTGHALGIVDFAPRRLVPGRRHAPRRVTLDGELAAVAGEQESSDVHRGPDRFASLDRRLPQVAEMRYVGGLTEHEIGEALGVADGEADAGPILG